MLNITSEEYEKIKKNAQSLSYQLGFGDNWFPKKREIRCKLFKDGKNTELTKDDVMFLLWCLNKSNTTILSLDEKETCNYITDILENGKYLLINGNPIRKKTVKEIKRQDELVDVFKKFGYL